MPIYEYTCDKCGTTVDKIVKYSEREEITPCPKCNNGNLIYVDKVHAGGFQLKGTGWYESDFKKK